LIKIALKAPLATVRAKAVAGITDENFLQERAINDQSWEVSSAAFEQLVNGGSMDEALLQALVSTLAGKLKGSKNVEVKRDCARYLHAIYARHPDSSVRKDIEVLEDTTIYEGSSHLDRYERIDDGYSIPIYHTDYANYPDHTDIPGEPAEYFSVKQTL
jgi:hypothetical protein